jgi:parallel beta-helix repeat protein
VTNSPAVTISAAPGAKSAPTFKFLLASGTSGWVFNGITFQGHSTDLLQPSYAIIRILAGTNFVFNKVTVESDLPANFASWTQTQWATIAAGGVQLENTANSPLNCVAMTNSLITGVANALNLFANGTYFAYNEVSLTSGDLLDYAGSNLIVYKNYLHDVICTQAGAQCGSFSGVHPDCMQGQIGNVPTGSPFNTYSNIIIDSNLCVRQTASAITAKAGFANWMQGIDAFDSQWNGVQITNNIVITGSCYGIFLSAASNSLVANNTIAYDNWGPLPGCRPSSAISGPSHEAPVGTNNIVANNIGEYIGAASNGTTVVGNYSGTSASVLFTNFRPPTNISNNSPMASFNLTLSNLSPALRLGVCTFMPAKNMNGTARSCSGGHVNPGAY